MTKRTIVTPRGEAEGRPSRAGSDGIGNRQAALDICERVMPPQQFVALRDVLNRKIAHGSSVTAALSQRLGPSKQAADRRA